MGKAKLIRSEEAIKKSKDNIRSLVLKFKRNGVAVVSPLELQEIKEVINMNEVEIVYYKPSNMYILRIMVRSRNTNN